MKAYEQIVNGSISRNKVSFYFTNISGFLPVFRLRQVFKVCGIFTDIFMAWKRNSRGQVYGFVRFSNVKNVEKLSHTLNNVWFGHLRVWAREAIFDRFASNDDKLVVVTRNGSHLVKEVRELKTVMRQQGEEENNVRR